MRKICVKLYRKLALIATILVLSAQVGRSQSVPLLYQYQFYQKFNADVYSIKNTAHTAMKPFLVDSTLQARYDDLMEANVDTDMDAWVYRKLFSEHLIDVRNPDYTFYFDLLTENIWGKDFKDKGMRNAKYIEVVNGVTQVKKSNFYPAGFVFKSPVGLNTRGFQLGGTIGKKFAFYTSGYENQAAFANYYDEHVNQTGTVPGQAYDRKFGRQVVKDWSYVTAVLSYTPIKQLNLILGQDKIFIGDGYRSLLLSDYAANYPLLKGTLKLGPVQYTAMWAQMQDRDVSSKFDTYGDNRRSWAAFHYVDWNITNRVSVGFFNGYIAPAADSSSKSRGFDINYINPVLFISTDGKTKQPGNSIAGFTAKYKFLDKHAVYGQILLDKVQGKEGKSKNSNGWQAGVRGADLFGVANLNYLAEYNTVKPYTYTGAERLSSYANFNEPLAHPFGANFREMTGILNYSTGRFDIQGQVMYAKYGLDGLQENNGKNIMIPFNSDDVVGTASILGISTTLKYAEATVAYVLNPRYNLRIEVGGLYRQEKNTFGTSNTLMATIGLRSSFRNLYHDF